MLTKPARVQSPDRHLNQVQDNFGKALEPVIGNPLVGGLLLKNVPIVAGSNTINHTLGRALQGWVVTRLRGPATAVPIVSDFQSYVPSVTNLFVSSLAMFWRYAGDCVEIKGRITVGSGGATATIVVGLPSVAVVDINKLGGTAFMRVGEVTATSSGGTAYKGTIQMNGSNATSVTFANADGTATGFDQIHPFTWAAGYTIDITDLKLPVVGRSAQSTSFAQIYDAQDLNTIPDKTLTLIASAPATVDLYVF